MTAHNQRLLIGVGTAAGVLWWLQQRTIASAAARSAAPRPVPSTTRTSPLSLPAGSSGSSSSSSDSLLGKLLSSLLGGKPGGGGGSLGFGGGSGGGSNTSGSGFRPNPAGDSNIGYVPGPGTPGYRSPTGTLDIPPGGDYGPAGITVDYQAQADALAAQLANFGPPQDSQDLLRIAYAQRDADNAAPLASRQQFITGEDGIQAPISGLPIFLAPDLGPGLSGGVPTPSSQPYENIPDLGAIDPTQFGDNGGMWDGGIPTLWGGSPNDSGFTTSTDAGLPQIPDLGAVDQSMLWGDQLPTTDLTARNSDYNPSGNLPDYFSDPAWLSTLGGNVNAPLGAPDWWPDGFAWYQ